MDKYPPRDPLDGACRTNPSRFRYSSMFCPLPTLPTCLAGHGHRLSYGHACSNLLLVARADPPCFFPSPVPDQVRSFAAVIFRRIASKTRKNEKGETVDTFISLARDQAAAIRQKLLESLAGDVDRSVRNKVSDAVAEVARQYTENSTSPTFVHGLKTP